MNQKLRVLMTVASCILGALNGIIVPVAVLSFSFCSSLEIHHFFCDVAALLPLSCRDTSAFETLLFICSVVMLIIPVSVIIGSYSRVLRAVIHMGFAESRHKAFTTCSSHLSVVGLYCGAAMFMYMRPASLQMPDQMKWYQPFTPSSPPC